MNAKTHPTRGLPHLTREVPPVNGRVRESIEDFRVEEVPLYAPSGEGEHFLFEIEKRGLSTDEAARRIGRALSLAPGDVAYAGRKDARAVTRQWMSVRLADVGRVRALEWPELRVLSAERHRNKLKLGHLAGNRFKIRVRGADADAGARARAVLDALASRGVPNWFGSQRFGVRGDSHLAGRALVKGDAKDFFSILLGGPTDADPPAAREARVAFDAGDLAAAMRAWPRSCPNERRALEALGRGTPPRRAVDRWPRRLRFLYVCAYQSELFNRVLAQRLEDMRRVEIGDIAMKHANGACFPVEDVGAASPRAAAFEISPTGPMFGSKMLAASGRPGELEREVLAGENLPLRAFASRMAMKARGERRALRVPLSEASANTDDDGLVLSFTLPRGAYATAVLAEVLKQPP